MIVFRSIAVPIKAALGYLLSIAAALGVGDRGLHLGLAGRPARHHRGRTAGQLPADHLDGRAVRAGDGLRGVPGLGHPRGLRPPRRRGRHAIRTGFISQRPRGHGRGGDHDLGVRRLHPARQLDDQADRPRSGGRGVRRRVPGPDDAGAGRAGAAREARRGGCRSGWTGRCRTSTSRARPGPSRRAGRVGRGQRCRRRAGRAAAIDPPTAAGRGRPADPAGTVGRSSTTTRGAGGAGLDAGGWRKPGRRTPGGAGPGAAGRERGRPQDRTGGAAASRDEDDLDVRRYLDAVGRPVEQALAARDATNQALDQAENWLPRCGGSRPRSRPAGGPPARRPEPRWSAGSSPSARRRPVPGADRGARSPTGPRPGAMSWFAGVCAELVGARHRHDRAAGRLDGDRGGGPGDVSGPSARRRSGTVARCRSATPRSTTTGHGVDGPPDRRRGRRDANRPRAAAAEGGTRSRASSRPATEAEADGHGVRGAGGRGGSSPPWPAVVLLWAVQGHQNSRRPYRWPS